MADIFPFRAFRYNPQLVNVSDTVTQPYDKISASMQDRYYSVNPYNLVRIILGRREDSDNTQHNVYSRAAGHFSDWRKRGVLKQDANPCIYAYSERFSVPGASQEMERLGFIALGRIEDYSAGVVFRHEQTLAKPKADRLELLRSTRAHFGQIFMLYEDGAEVEACLASATSRSPEIEVRDEYGVVHRVWAISEPALIQSVQHKMRGKRLIIADGHHRYETALNYRKERRLADTGSETGQGDVSYDRLMMTFVNMNSSGLLILPTHRVVHSLQAFSIDEFRNRTSQFFHVEEIDSAIDTARALAVLHGKRHLGTVLLAVTANRALLISQPSAAAAQFLAQFSRRQQELDVVQLHKVVLEGVLGLSEESIRNQQNISYVRDAAEALSQARNGKADIAFLMNPCRVEQVREVAFAGEVLPQKSTDFYPKLLSGLTIYALE